MEGAGCQDTCGGPTVHDYGIGEGEGEGSILLLKFRYILESQVVEWGAFMHKDSRS